MTTITLTKIGTILATSAILTLPIVTASNAEITIDGGHKLSVCVLDGGLAVSNGKFRSCWNPVTDETTDCAKSGDGGHDQCVTEPVTEERPTRGKHIKSVANGGDAMIMQSDTNTTVGTPTKPLVGKMVIRNVTRK